ncbi:putative manganese transporter [Candidatus Rhodobacter oscarellae]|nr:putative manganese transporter [Candidatus Rhodobacter lobularis]
MPETFVARDKLGPFRSKRLVVALILIGLIFAPGALGEVTQEMVADAYLAVSVFVAATLLLFYSAERVFNFDIGEALKGSRGAQVPLAALLGATPGCGGAVVVVAAYSSGKVGFGAVVATLTATMGDAAFLLIATRPDAAVIVLPLSIGVGILSGCIVDAVNTTEFRATTRATELVPAIGKTRPQDMLFLGLALPGLAVGAAGLMQVEILSILGVDPLWLAITGTVLGLLIWATSPLKAMTSNTDSPVTRMAEETSFIAVWVIGAFLAYEYAVAFLGLDLAAWFNAIAPVLPLIAVLVGFVPGCGPQILVTTLYINGVIPFAALIGNAISNDGDALFPAIALNPRAAIAATLYSAVPALVVAYGFFFLAPGFLN